MKKAYRHVLTLILITIVIGAIRILGLTQVLTFDWLHNNITVLKGVVEQHYIVSVIGYAACYMVVLALAIPGSSIFISAAGLLFGMLPGIIYALIGGVLGSSLLFLTSRYLLGSWFQERYSHRLGRFNDEVQQYGAYYVLMVRMLAVVPTGLVTICSGLTVLPLSSFMWTTGVGMIPAALMFTFAGQRVASLESLHDFLCPSLWFAGVAFLTFKVALVPLIAHTLRRRLQIRKTNLV